MEERIVCEACDQEMPDEETAERFKWKRGWDGWLCLSCDTGEELCKCKRATVTQGHICDVRYHQ